MKILVFGNIGSGKSTVIKELKELFPFEVIAIDDFRKSLVMEARQVNWRQEIIFSQR